MKILGIYIHIPFCKKKCKYCDFVSFENFDNACIKEYVKSILIEINEKANIIKSEGELYAVRSIYIGGGTPSIIRSAYISNILNSIYDNFNITDDCEISIEVNPGTATKSKFEEYKASGINRLSVGLQTSNDELLKLLGRIHNYNQYENTIKLAQEVGFKNINTDLIIGIPNQTIFDIEDSLNKLLALNITHISIYSLILEDGTLLTKQVNSGELKLPDDEIERYMYWYAKRRLEDNGFTHYEISNYALPTYRCKHNLDCWRQHEYIGFGLNAASYRNNIRYKNTSDMKRYIGNLENGRFKSNIIIEEKQNKRDKMNEFMILGLRTLNGINIDNFKFLFNENCITFYHKTINKLMKEDLIEINNNNIRLSKKGLDYANIVWEEFI